ncbi:MAG: FAD-dependent oxidoreductase [candidate division WOR-3 bacterium]
MGLKVLIVGGVAGGASVAARLRRLNEEAEIILFERGEYISYANCGLPYYLGGVIGKKEHLIIMTPEIFKKRFKVDVRIGHEVIKIDRSQKQVEVFDRINGRTYRESYDKLVLSPGAEPFRPPIKGIDLEGVFTLRTIPDAEAINRFIAYRKAKQTIILGAGAIGLEVAENLRKRGLEVTLTDVLNQVLPYLDQEMSFYVEENLKQEGISLKLGQPVLTFEKKGEKISVRWEDGEEKECDFVILATGIKPEVKLAIDAGLDIGENGGIKVNEFLQTNDPDIYAVGDAIETEELISKRKMIIPLAGPANKQGRVVANNICGRQERYKGTLATSILKVFNITVASTGINERSLPLINEDYEKIYLHPYDHATYYPGASPIHMKILFSKKSKRILGAQMIGQIGVDKRIDVIATAIYGGLNIIDLKDLHLAYSPPYGSAKDPINMVGFIAENIIKNIVNVTHWDRVDSGDFLLDVRSEEEFKKGHVPYAVNIPLESLRFNLDKLPQNRLIKVYCSQGLRSYIACRILMQKGYQAENLSGGYLTYLAYKEKGLTKLSL